MGSEGSIWSGGRSPSSGAALKGMGEGRRDGGCAGWRSDWRDGGEGGRDDMLLAAAADNGYMFAPSWSRDRGLCIYLVVERMA